MKDDVIAGAMLKIKTIIVFRTLVKLSFCGSECTHKPRSTEYTGHN